MVSVILDGFPFSNVMPLKIIHTGLRFSRLIFVILDGFSFYSGLFCGHLNQLIYCIFKSLTNFFPNCRLVSEIPQVLHGCFGDIYYIFKSFIFVYVIPELSWLFPLFWTDFSIYHSGLPYSGLILVYIILVYLILD